MASFPPSPVFMYPEREAQRFGNDVSESSKDLEPWLREYSYIYARPPKWPESGIREKLAGSSNNNMPKESEDPRYNFVHIPRSLRARSLFHPLRPLQPDATAKAEKDDNLLLKSLLPCKQGSEIGKHENLRSSRVLTSTVGKTNLRAAVSLTITQVSSRSQTPSQSEVHDPSCEVPLLSPSPPRSLSPSKSPSSTMGSRPGGSTDNDRPTTLNPRPAMSASISAPAGRLSRFFPQDLSQYTEAFLPIATVTTSSTSLAELAHLIRLQGYQEQRKAHSRVRLHRWLVSSALSARLVHCGELAHRTLVDNFKSYDKKSFATLYNALHDIRNSCDVTRRYALLEPDLESAKSKSAKNEKQSFSTSMNEVPSKILDELVDFIYEIRGEPAHRTLVDNFRSNDKKSFATLATKRHYEVPGSLNGAQVTAFPDTGAEKNVISLDFVVRNKLNIQRDSQLKFQLPTGKVSRSVGTAYLPWQFAGESKVFNVLFSVLPKCTHDVIIGGKFLKFTETLTKFASRIKTKLLPFSPRLGVKLLGSQRQRVWGSLDGERAVAVPDTGSDVMLVSTAYAMQRGFRISGQKDCRSELEFADGSRAFTRGLVKDVDWSFDDSDTSYRCDFHVLDNLSVDVVLSNDFLFNVNAFSEYDSSFFDEDDVSAEGYVELSLVRQISWLSNRIQKLFSRKTQEITDINKGRQEDERRELQRRDAIDDAIAGMPEDSPSEVRDKKEAQRMEDHRRERWRQIHLQRPAGFVQTQPQDASSRNRAPSSPFNASPVASQPPLSSTNASTSSRTRLLSAHSLPSASVRQPARSSWHHRHAQNSQRPP